ncbi:MAG: hypothetical protein AAGF54_20140 [Pseudomonadota bacterium]
MKLNLRELKSKILQNLQLITCFLAALGFLQTGSTHAATIGFSGNVVAQSQGAFQPERENIVTFTDTVGIRFRSENDAAEPVKIILTIHDSKGQRVKPVSISGSAIVKPHKYNLVTLVLPMDKRPNEVFEFCLKQITKSKTVLRTTCSKLKVARYN